MNNSNDNQTPQEAVTRELKCSGCGALLKYAAGTHKLVCMYCGAETAIVDRTEKIEEIDFERFIQEQYAKEEKIEIATVKCTACGATVTFQPDVTADHCPYCSANIVVKSGSTSKLLKPRAVIPFSIDKKKALGLFQGWLASRWFAPSDLKKRAAGGQLDGIYIPYWTYDARAHTRYTGERGTYYYTTETYTTQENGRTVTRTRQVRHTRWTSKSGEVNNVFDDILVPANTSLPEKYIYALEPWKLQALLPFNEEYLSGFRAQSYQVDLKGGLVIAKQRMEPIIVSTIRSDIGGDEQRIHTKTSVYSGVTFKHILLPIWISSYRYGAKIFRFLVNGQSGEIQGERPYSALKITLLVIGILAAAAAVFFLFVNR
jgi:LSD1 subclass zinc finger protein